MSNPSYIHYCKAPLQLMDPVGNIYTIRCTLARRHKGKCRIGGLSFSWEGCPESKSHALRKEFKVVEGGK